MNRVAARRIVSAYLEIPVARGLAYLGLSPNAVTTFGLLIAGVAAYLVSVGYLWAGGVALLVSGLLDLFDGALARITSRVSPFGALLDSFVDRASEAAVLLGLLVFYLSRSSVEGAILVYLALVGSVLVSYLRARAEGLGIECRVGVMTRPERVAVLGVGLVLGHWWWPAVFIALGLIAALTLITVVQRLFHARQSLKEQE